MRGAHLPWLPTMDCGARWRGVGGRRNLRLVLEGADGGLPEHAQERLRTDGVVVNAAIPSVEELSRPAKALIDSGRVTAFGDAADILAANVPTIVAGADADSYGY